MNPEHLDNEVWMHKFRRGDESTLKELFDVYGGSLFFFANRLLNNPKQAEDIVAESFIKLWRQRETFIELQNIKAYLYVITRNACNQHTNPEEQQSLIKQEWIPLAHDTEEMLTRVVHGDVLQLICDEIKKLPEPATKIFKLCFAEGLQPEEIAPKLNMTVQHVRNNKEAILELLRLSLGKNNVLISLALLEIICVSIAQRGGF